MHCTPPGPDGRMACMLRPRPRATSSTTTDRVTGPVHAGALCMQVGRCRIAGGSARRPYEGGSGRPAHHLRARPARGSSHVTASHRPRPSCQAAEGPGLAAPPPRAIGRSTSARRGASEQGRPSRRRRLVPYGAAHRNQDKQSAGRLASSSPPHWRQPQQLRLCSAAAS